ncbi:MAG TPA: hypothetical protein VJY41_07555 [Prolixibacteraceae bacterium]|nr:hypothetical protein [Prolixibacteraceae bacterium]
MKLLNIAIAGMFLFLLSCNVDDPVNPKNSEHNIKKEVLSGYVQKGPFINGTSIVIFELDSNLIQTGRTFNTQINNNTGIFEIKGIELVSPFVEIKADGFYFNENTGEISSERIILNALSNLNEQNTVNINVLTTLEKHRLTYLSEQGIAFNEAKKQAQQEVLTLFEMAKPEINNSENLNIAEQGDDNAILLAASVILQSDRSVSELAELLANISFDLKTDGILNSPAFGSQLINSIKNMELLKVRNNILSRYASLDMNVELPDFESKINHFITNTPFEYTLSIQYPDSGKYGKNILSLNDGDIIATHQFYSLNALIPKGCKLKVAYQKTSTSIYGDLIRYALMGDIATWQTPVYSNIEFTEWLSKEEFNNADSKNIFEGVGSCTFDIYENEVQIPTRSITVSWDFVNESAFVFPDMGLNGENLFAMENNTVLDKSKKYSLALTVPTLGSLNNYYIVVENTSDTGDIKHSSAIGWEYIEPNKNNNFFFKTVSSSQADATIQLEGEGTLKLFIEDSTYKQIIVCKTFSWK